MGCCRPALSLLLVSFAFIGRIDAVPRVEISCGPVHGIDDTSTGVAAFLGIPYAIAPVGPRRWQPPVRPTQENHGCWKGELIATDPGPACLQKGRYGKVESSEDCLRLHVHTNTLPHRQHSGKLKPVLVWLHGGDLVEGSPFAIQSGFGAQANLTGGPNGAVVVSVQYRLGVAGFLSLAALAHHHDTRGKAGNYGFLDVLEALHWIQQNVVAFGGDPDRVTVWGQSSGGSLVIALLASPASRGLLHGGISMSGSPRLNSTEQEAWVVWHRQMVAQTRCAGIGFTAAAEANLTRCLLDLSAEELLDAQPADWTSNGFSFGVFSHDWRYAPLLLVDGHNGVLPHDYITSFSADPSRIRVPLILGITRQESDFAPGTDVRNMSIQQFQNFVARSLGVDYSANFIKELLRLYGLNPGAKGGNDFEPQRVFSDIITDATFFCPTLHLAHSMTCGRQEHTAPVFVYAASQTYSNPFCVLEKANDFIPPYCPLYAFHASDEFAMLQPGYSASNFPYRFSAVDRKYGALLKNRVLEFASTGNVAKWQTFGGPKANASCSNRKLLDEYAVIDMAVEDQVIPEDHKAKCNFWLRHGFYNTTGFINVDAALFSEQQVFV